MTVASNQDASELADLRDAVAGWARRHSDSTVRCNADHAGLQPAFWATLADLGWLSLLSPRSTAAAGLPEQAIVLEELDAELGPLLPSLWFTTLVQLRGTGGQRADLLPGLAAGQLIGAVGLASGLRGRPHDDGTLVDGTVTAVLGEASADVIAVPVSVDCGTACLLPVTTRRQRG